MLALGLAVGFMPAFLQLSSSITSSFSSSVVMVTRVATQMASSSKTEFIGADKYDGRYTRNYDIANNYYKAHSNDKEATMHSFNNLSNVVAKGNLTGAMQIIEPYASDNNSLIKNDVKKVQANLNANLDDAKKRSKQFCYCKV